MDDHNLKQVKKGNKRKRSKRPELEIKEHMFLQNQLYVKIAFLN